MKINLYLLPTGLWKIPLLQELDLMKFLSKLQEPLDGFSAKTTAGRDENCWAEQSEKLGFLTLFT